MAEDQHGNALGISTYVGFLAMARAESVGFQKHLSKPVEPEELVRAIASILLPCHSKNTDEKAGRSGDAGGEEGSPINV